MQTDPTAQTATDLAAIDRCTAAFFNAFTNRGGTKPNIGVLSELFIPDATIIKNVGGKPVHYDVPGFIEPRAMILMDGTLKEFCEEETSQKTEIFGNIAHRFSLYAKSWLAAGERCEGRGAKSIQYIRTPSGWKISSLVWDDEAEAAPERGGSS